MASNLASFDLAVQNVISAYTTAMSSEAPLKQILLPADPLVFDINLMFLSFLICWVLTLITDNYSWVDRWWSLSVPTFALYFMYVDPSPRILLMGGLSIVWGARLTYNFARKGGYSPSTEDYRWATVKAETPKWVWPIFNLVFIGFIQCLGLFLLSVPLYLAWLADKEAKGGYASLNYLDAIAAFLYASLVFFETLADQQQWNFQERKRLARENNLDISKDPELKQGFISSGLFRYSRHPNFFCEITIWWVFYLFGVAATSACLNWTITGTVLLTLLFQGSTPLTERITASKYPAYKIYQQKTSRLVPFLPKD